jgi:plasmid stabilization system protein ParE
MAYNIIIGEPAREDIQTAYDHYEDERKALGEESLDELLKRFDSLSEKPYNYGFIDDQAIIRDVKIDRFPYVIVFDIIDNKVIVHAVHCTHKHPKKRLRK